MPLPRFRPNATFLPMRIPTTWLALLLGLWAAAPARAQLADLSLEELMDIEVFTASRRPERLAQTPAAAAVLTRDDLRRAGVTSIPEALRLVPGMEVARLSTARWAVTARGFNDLFANKLLVLIDGRSVYTPLFSGVFWDELPFDLDEIERIEVIRGPGAALWGANAVNGIVNIITRSAADAPDWSLHIAAGTTEQARGTLGIARALGGGHARLTLGAVDRAGLPTGTAGRAHDGWRAAQAEGRFDRHVGAQDSLTVVAGLHAGEMEQAWDLSLSPAEAGTRSVVTTTPAQHGYLLTRWTRRHDDVAETAAQLSVSHAERDEAPTEGDLTVFDLDVHHSRPVGESHDVIAGLALRHTRDRLHGSFAAQIDPERRRYSQASAFTQMTLQLHPALRAVLGTKIEAFDLGDVVAWQPNARLLYTPTQRAALWAAASRAVRTPSRSDHDLLAARPAPPELVPEGFPNTFVQERGSRDFQPEEVVTFEAGGRGELREDLSVDVAAYHSLYDRLRTTEPRLPVALEDDGISYIVVPFVVDNLMAATTQGFEVAVDWRPRRWLRLRPAWTLRRMEIELDDDSAYDAGLTWEGVSPTSQFVLRASADLRQGWQLDVTGRRVGRLADAGVPAYTTLDARVAWQVGERWSLEVVGHDLLEAQHAEFAVPHLPTRALDAERGVRLGLRWQP
jgi:iron complex outermembrane receptor protein